jgi:type I restriction-modification system DNA methylase subunit
MPISTKRKKKAPKTIAGTRSLSTFVKSICDIMRRSNCASALQYVPELTWILFLRILDAQEKRGREAADAVGARADRVIARVRACAGDVLLFAHRDIFRVLAARWLGLAAREGRYFYLATASLSVLGYHHDLDEPVIHLWNDARH